MTTTWSLGRVAGERDEEADAQRLQARLIAETGSGEAEVSAAIAAALDRLRDARVREFVMLLAERDVRQQLRQR